MPSNHSILLDDSQRLPTFKEPREQRHGETNRIGRSPQLLPQEQIFGGERTSGTKPGPKQRKHV
jgi:hypothetical protein